MKMAMCLTLREVRRRSRRGENFEPFTNGEEEEEEIHEKKRRRSCKSRQKEEEKDEGRGEGGSSGPEQEEEEEEEGEVYDLPGQKRHPPDERDPLRIFYETLYQRLPGSEMAALWMMESGLLPLEEAKKVYKKKQKLKSPIKAVASLKRSVDSVTVEKAKAKHHDHSLSSPALSVKKSVVVESKSVSKCKESSKRKSRDGDGDTWENERDDDFHLAKKKTKKLNDGT
ncbi:hypothetical protein NE237_018870 [Protea cynaroides]|uniref:Uncharacterized protein n=1 Tax=Protea cynaroides TaxID=273540 RepID=A0A9Q0KAW9_9MAGN|nr:hypothetical protein NE237_018870 [Protea cynaroides]